MPTFWDSVPQNVQDWALGQAVFFTASAPRTGKHINVSPKGLPASTFTIFDPNHAAYIDATGSGCETISHVYENGRITVMFCSFDTAPRIVRFFCTGRVVEWDQPGFEVLLKRMSKDRLVGARAIILLDIFKVQNSCGFGVPLLATEKTADVEAKASFDDRQTLGHWASKQVEKNAMRSYQKQWNSASLDGVPGLKTARRDAEGPLWFGDLRAWLRNVAHQKGAVLVGMAISLAWIVLLRFLGVVA